MLAEIQGYLHDGKSSQRTIAQRTGVSRGVVQAVARGKYRLHAPLARNANGEFQPPRGPYLRCPNCGGKVRMPCLGCYLRARSKRKGEIAAP
jgi:hypothetical protein